MKKLVVFELQENSDSACVKIHDELNEKHISTLIYTLLEYAELKELSLEEIVESSLTIEQQASMAKVLEISLEKIFDRLPSDNGQVNFTKMN